MMVMFKTTTTFANIAPKLIVTAQVFLINIQMPVMIKVRARKQRKSSIPCCQCNIVQLIVVAVYHTYRKHITSLFIKRGVNFAAHSPRMPYSVVPGDQGCRTKIVILSPIIYPLIFETALDIVKQLGSTIFYPLLFSSMFYMGLYFTSEH